MSRGTKEQLLLSQGIKKNEFDSYFNGAALKSDNLMWDSRLAFFFKRWWSDSKQQHVKLSLQANSSYSR